MSRGKKKKYADLFAGTGAADDYFGTIYDSMIKSKAYQDLSIGARQFYTLCRVQASSKRGRQTLYKHAKEDNAFYSENCFVFPAKHLEIYGMKRSNARKYFVELINAGFIDLLEENQHRQRVNVYSFSGKWKTNDTS